ncbi:DUF1593 domain-containing protein [Mucilaginibacter auburnensis]|uniref:Uncharacterized protein DUF1593 n=1 Tax=Mucilaginibacter auburnensis TaxID=1457233 RepID=A0A2H9VSL0_9SPHI|nr:DUF1593 domain-containing protein [Mucilaginibacter auburnensis]PJJ83804.1 uncharacterized protein DUF1593 [Mucilaginibacter auburnensis]
MRKYFVLLALLCAMFKISIAQKAKPLNTNLKPRVIVLTDIAPIDIEPDDMESLIRLLSHADLFEIEGLVSTTGWSDYGDKEHPEIIHDVINAYEKDLPNLQKRSAQISFSKDESRQQLGYWPSPAYLRSRTVLGSTKMGVAALGETNNSAGSDLIIKMADEQDERPLWILVWGGGNTVAQAIWKVQKERPAADLKKFLHKLRVYTITDQDHVQFRYKHNASSHYWMRKEFADDLFFVWDESAWLYQNNTGKSRWDEYARDIQNHGALGAIYPKFKWGVEGDTPSFLYVWPNGLNDPENPSAGGWGGYFQRGISADSVTTAYINQKNTPANAISKKYQEKFYQALFNSFAARMDWAKDGKGNRNPTVIVNGDKTINLIRVNLKPGTTFTLDAAATTDAEGDQLHFNWWILTEAGTYQQPIAIDGSTSPKIKLKVPADAAGKTFHVICEVTDNGTPALTSYRRIIVSALK